MSTSPVTSVVEKFREQRQALVSRFWEKPDGPLFMRQHADLLDALIHDLLEGHGPSGIAIAAQGGYGRRTLAPHSDIDLLVTVTREAPEGLLASLLAQLWDAGLRVGHAVRTPEQMVASGKDDAVAAAAMLDARYVWGDRELFQTAFDGFVETAILDNAEAFVAAKEAEARTRQAQLDAGRVEPDLKNGPGGWRDWQTQDWIQRAQGTNTPPSPARQKAFGILCTIRTGLHLLAGKPQDRLVFALQADLARQLGYRGRSPTHATERMMRQLHGAMARIAAGEAIPLEGSPLEWVQLFLKAREHGKPLSPETVTGMRLALHTPSSRRKPESTPTPDMDPGFRQDDGGLSVLAHLLTTPHQMAETDLYQLSNSGLLGFFLPDFGRTRGLMQFDMVHIYTVDAHTLRALVLAHRLALGLETEALPVASRLFHELERPRVLLLAVLLHDIAKGQGGDHSDKGAVIARALAPRLGFSAGETELVAWLVQNHLLMSFYAFKRDVQDPETLRTFVDAVESPERLRYLAILTAIDIRATNPALLTPWKQSLLRTLYDKAMSRLDGQLAQPVEKQLPLSPVLRNWQDALPPDYWDSFPPQMQQQHLDLFRRVDADDPQQLLSRFDHNPEDDVTEVTLCTRDRPGLFALFAGTMALAGVSIVAARIFTLANGWLLDSFSVQDKGGAVQWDDRLQRLSQKLQDVWDGKIDLDAQLAAMPVETPVTPFPPRVRIDADSHPGFTLVEVTAPDRRGLLYHLLVVMRDMGLQVMRARIMTQGVTASDVFYVVERGGGKITSATIIAVLRQRLLDVASGAETT